LNIGQPDIKTPEVAMNAVRNFDIKVLEYSHSAGFESYRSKLAQFYKIKDYPSMLKILLQQVDQKLCFCNGKRWILEMKSSSQNHFTQIQWFSAASGVNVVSVIFD
jgi:aspartate aminotransferase